FQAGPYQFTTSQGKSLSLDVAMIPSPVELSGAWSVRFPPHLGAPPSITLDRLASWTEYSDPGVRYFSGTAEYEKQFDVPADLLGRGKALYIDLGVVHDIAEVTLNGRNLGIWWKPPFTADVSAALKPGANTLTVHITNTWANRLIGD